jgi:hypothetical protein
MSYTERGQISHPMAVVGACGAARWKSIGGRSEPAAMTERR